MKKEDPAIRLNRRLVADGDCVVFTGSKNACGYGLIGVNGKLMMTHRLSYILRHGNIPDGMNILHRCDNPACVKPEHLYAGTQQDNVADMLRRGRGGHPRGEKHYAAKITSNDAGRIRSLYRTGKATQKMLAMRFGISKSQVHNIVSGKKWR